MEIQYKGYTIFQSNYNNHVSIYKNNKLIMHISFTEKPTDTELKSIVELYLLR